MTMELVNPQFVKYICPLMGWSGRTPYPARTMPNIKKRVTAKGST